MTLVEPLLLMLVGYEMRDDGQRKAELLGGAFWFSGCLWFTIAALLRVCG